MLCGKESVPICLSLLTLVILEVGELFGTWLSLVGEVDIVLAV